MTLRSDGTVMEARGLQLQVAWACRILAMHGHADLTLGHVSARGPDGAIYMKRSGLGLNEVTPEDVLCIDLEARKVSGRGEVHLEAVLHTEAYRVRPDVGAIVHSHPLYTTALAVSRVELQTLGHDSILFHDGLGYFDATAEMITRVDQGRAVADALGGRRAVLLRNHGVLVVGRDVPWMTYCALTLERAAMIQSVASTLGPLQPLLPEMAERVFQLKYPDNLIRVYWDYLVRQARRTGNAEGMPDDAG
jgi:L-fuculose-phosphate aldolase